VFFESASAGFDLPKRNLQRPSLGLLNESRYKIVDPSNTENCDPQVFSLFCSGIVFEHSFNTRSRKAATTLLHPHPCHRCSFQPFPLITILYRVLAASVCSNLRVAFSPVTSLVASPYRDAPPILAMPDMFHPIGIALARRSGR
jgi:hypothetical protein